MLNKKAIICYVPVLHEGYRRFFEKYKDADLYIFGQEIIEKFDYLYKEIRALKPEEMKKAIEALGIFKEVFILDETNIKDVQENYEEIIFPREDVTEELTKKYFADKKTVIDEIFLRWDKHNTVKTFPVSPDIKISKDELDKKMMLQADEISKKSTDWWRRIGAVVAKDGKIIFETYNKHVPSEHMPSVNGDPRSGFHKGDHLELSSSIHSEARVVAEAAKKGMSLTGAQMYTTTFPCPPCAKLIAYCGIKKLYYSIGYGVLDGESILKQNGVEIIFVDVDLPDEKGFETIEYKK